MMANDISSRRYAEFSDPRLVAIYNSVNPIDDYKDFYINVLAQTPVKSIVDIGCGSGLLTCKLAQLGYDMFGIEPSEAMLGLARKSSCGEEVEWVEGGVEKLKDVSADAAIMTGHVAQFFLGDEEWQKALESIYSALSLGGYVVFESRPSVSSLLAPWPTKTSPRKVNDPVMGQLSWWAQDIELTDDYAKYELHYFFEETLKELVSVNELRFRTLQELEKSLVNAGFGIQDIYGDWDFSPISEESLEMIFVVRKV